MYRTSLPDLKVVIYLWFQTQWLLKNKNICNKMSSYKKVFSIKSPHGPGGVFFAWQRTSGGYLATTGYDQVWSTYLYLYFFEVSPSRPLGASLRRWWMRTAFSLRSSSQLLFKSSMLCSVLYGVVFHLIFFPPLTISSRSSAFFWTAAHSSILWFLLKAYSMVLTLSHSHTGCNESIVLFRWFTSTTDMLTWCDPGMCFCFGWDKERFSSSCI